MNDRIHHIIFANFAGTSPRDALQNVADDIGAMFSTALTAALENLKKEALGGYVTIEDVELALANLSAGPADVTQAPPQGHDNVAPSAPTQSQQRDLKWLTAFAQSKGYNTIYGAVYAADPASTRPPPQPISVDVSTGDHDAGHRIFAELTGEVASDGKTLLAVETSRNFAIPPAAPGEVVAWMRDNKKECTTAASKLWMETCDFGVWAEIAKRYTIPLTYLTTSAAPLEAKAADPLAPEETRRQDPAIEVACSSCGLTMDESRLLGNFAPVAHLASLACQLAASYPDTLPGLYVDDEPVGAQMVTAARGLNAAPAPALSGWLRPGWKVERSENVLTGNALIVRAPDGSAVTLRAQAPDPTETVLYRYFHALAQAQEMWGICSTRVEDPDGKPADSKQSHPAAQQQQP